MHRNILAIIVAILATTSCFAQLPKIAGGTLKRYERFASKHITPRTVEVWLPENYSATKKYAVLYMHDGQMLFDSTNTWNSQEWKVDETLSGLLAKKQIKNTIVVAVWNNGAYRFSEYFPEKALPNLPDSISLSLVQNELMGEPQADEYLLFLTQELKPFIDSTYSTYPDRANTLIAGSSMGGLISLYAICEYPEVFGGAACLSTHWPGSLRLQNTAIPNGIITYLKQKLPSPKTHKLYFDYGTATLDALYKPYQQLVDEVMKQKGYSNKNWVTKEFAGEGHSEKAWSKRLHLPLLFLLGIK
ncbi:alpha/beta hydrolase [Pontibacter sp. KCTC 32443]|uniref:alpha/beta hydrolase n=1 Tax=Pontibacter TaxID=323449 RepID=UPI00164E2332|nr:MULTISPECIES: alpha/beta hydrolase-fold protein [Pontibacter]MBC5774895.1 alpha/beta hydrolase [Pontibacter sp. KCTC 32443]